MIVDCAQKHTHMSEPGSPIKLGTQSQHSSEQQRLEDLKVPEILISAHISDEGTHKGGGSVKGGARAASVRQSRRSNASSTKNKKKLTKKFSSFQATPLNPQSRQHAMGMTQAVVKKIGDDISQA